MQVVDFVNLDYEVLRDTIFLSNFRVVADLPCLRGRSARIAYRTNDLLVSCSKVSRSGSHMKSPVGYIACTSMPASARQKTISSSSFKVNRTPPCTTLVLMCQQAKIRLKKRGKKQKPSG